MTKIAVVILNYNGRDFLNQFIPNLITYTPEAEIIVADNASTDDSLEVLKAFREVKVVTLPKNYGYAGGYNQALKQIDADYYALVNSDIEVTDNWLPPLISFLENNTEYASVQPKIRDYNRKTHFEYAGAAGGYLDFLGYPYCRGRLFDTLEKDTGQYDDIRDVHWATGACFVIRSEKFHEVGGFDDSFFAHMEELDLAWRLSSKGYKSACVPTSEVFHVGGGTLNKIHPRKTYLNFRNALALLIKNLPYFHLIFILPVRIVLDVVAGIKFSFSQGPAHLLAVLKGILHALGRLPKYIAHSPRSAITNEHQSIVWAYFVRKVKRYNDL